MTGMFTRIRKAAYMLLGIIAFVPGTKLSAADYTITTASGALVITDVSGNTETLNMSQSGSNVNFTLSLAARTYSINGGPDIAFSTPASIPLAGLTSITVNTGGGNDVLNVGAFTAALPNLTINGGSGNDVINFNGNITFLANASLDVDLQNDAVPTGTDAVLLNAGADLLLSGAGAAVVRVSKSITFTTGTTLQTADGDLTLQANQQLVPETGTFIGVRMDASSLVECTGAGTLTVTGKGGETIGFNYGVSISSGTIRGGTTNPVTVSGRGGGSGGGINIGVNLNMAASVITSSGSNVFVIGQGGGTSSSSDNSGVTNAGTISAGGSGTVNVTGLGGATFGNNNYGIFASGLITSSGGNVSLNGTGGGSGASAANVGIILHSGGTITAGGLGTVTVNGTGGSSSGNQNIGVMAVVSGASITSGGGNVSITGTGGGSGTSASNYGVWLKTASFISAGGNGTVTVTGTGGPSQGNENIGVNMGITLGSYITSTNGNVTINGYGGGSGTSSLNHGILLHSSNFSAGGVGSISVTGVGGPSTGSPNHGIWITNNGMISTPSGDVLVTASKGANSTNASDLLLDMNGRINTTGTSANITIQTPVSGTWPHTVALDMSNASASQNIQFASGSRLNIDIDGTVPNSTFQQLNLAGRINLNNANLSFAGSTHTPAVGQSFRIVSNDATDPVTGTFNGLPEGAIITGFLGSALSASISYVAGTGNDVVITVIACAPPAFTTCPDPTPTDLSAAIAGAGCSANVSYSPAVSGAAPITYSYVFSGATTGTGTGTGSGSSFNTGNTIVTITATNACGSATCSFVVRVKDITPPAITCPADLAITCLADVPAADPSLVSAGDACGIASTSFLGQTGNGGTACAGNALLLTRTFSATDNNGNVSTCTQVITIESTPVVPSLTAGTYACGYNISCAGAADGSITATSAGGCAPYSYLWSNGATTQVLSGLAAGAYSVTITDANGCTGTGSITLSAPAALSVDAGPNATVFAGYSSTACTTLNGSAATGGCPAYVYTWSTSSGIIATGTSVSVCPVITTTYYYTAQDANGCTATDSVKVCVVNVVCASTGGGPKITICHTPPSVDATSCVPLSSVSGHLSHGDYIGPCTTGSTTACGGPSSARISPAQSITDNSIQLSAYPNPFSSTTTLEFTLNEDEWATLRVFTVTGVQVAELFEGAAWSGQTVKAEFSAADLPEGIYFASLTTQNGNESHLKLVINR